MFSCVEFGISIIKRNNMLHPAIAHFAISLPIISLVLGLIYLYKPSETMSKISTRFLVFAAIFTIAAYFTGKNDASEVWEYLTSDAKSLLSQHANLGLYLAIGMVAAALVKMFGCHKQIFKLEIVAVLLLLVLSGATIFQGKMGGELTFTHGANVDISTIVKTKADEEAAKAAAAAAKAAAEFDDEDEDEDSEE